MFGVRFAGQLPDLCDGLLPLVNQRQDSLVLLAVRLPADIFDDLAEERLLVQMRVMFFGQFARNVHHLCAHDTQLRLGEAR